LPDYILIALFPVFTSDGHFIRFRKPDKVTIVI